MNLNSSRRTMVIRGVIACLLLALSGMTGISSAADSVLYAKPGATGLCTSWTNACSLQYALASSTAGEEIWVAEGTHKPGASRTDTFQLVNGVGVYGGFAGTETSRDERDWTLHDTILSGDIGTAGDDSDNSYHVVTVSGTDATAILDGFTITGGNADGSDLNDRGGGMYNDGSSPTLTNVTFSGNSAIFGGGMGNYSESSPTLVNVTFSGNSAAVGGGMHNYLYSSPTLTNVTFSGNSAALFGGGMENYNSSPTLTNCILWGNTALLSGPQIYNGGTGSTTVTYSDIQGGYSGTGNIDLDPLFVRNPDPGDGDWTTPGDNDYGDLRLQLTSPAIDVGDNNALPAGITTDLGGNPRISNNIVDMGAYEAPPDHLCVDQDAAGSNDGTCWAGAFNDLQDALTWAVEGVQIWVAEGTYKPGTDRTVTFQLKDGVAVYGGFAGSEGSLEERDWTVHETILSGDIGTPDDTSDNSYHVVSGSGTDATAILDGFTVTGGNANGDWPYSEGGGIFNYGGSPTLTNVTFSGNSAHLYGGGMENSNSSSPTLVNVTFSGNSAHNGGGMENWNSSSPTLVNVTFSGNFAYYGGGMHNYFYSSPTLVNVTFSGNSADYGGGMFNDTSSAALSNVTFSGNSADFGGGMANYWNSSPTLTNVTFSGNSAALRGGGMAHQWNSNPTVTNCILWGNTAPNGPQIYNDFISIPKISYSDIQQGGYSGTGNIEADPEFVDPDGADDIVGTLDDDLRLQPTSPAIDAGDNGALPADTLDLDEDGDIDEPLPLDLDGYPRCVDVTGIPDTGVGPGPIVDMGASEAQWELAYVPLVLKN